MTKSVQNLVEQLEGPLKEYLDNEEDRLERELEFLKKVHAGISGGATLESSSSALADIFLAESLNPYFPE